MSTTHVDPRNSPEFKVNVTVSKPKNGTHFVAGEKPVATVTIKDLTGKLMDHTKLEKQSAQGCKTTGCPTWSGKFNHVYMFVTGPRANRNPVLTSASRAKIVASTAGPYNLSAASATLDLIVDANKTIYKKKLPYSGTISVKVSAGTFANKAAATATEVVTWLNGDAYFKARAVAYLSGGKVAIRSRNLGTLFSVQLKTSAVTTAVFSGDTAVKTIGGYYARNELAATSGVNSDPGVKYTAGAVTYTMDAVDDLKPLLEDESPVVRDAAATAIEALKQ